MRLFWLMQRTCLQHGAPYFPSRIGGRLSRVANRRAELILLHNFHLAHADCIGIFSSRAGKIYLVEIILSHEDNLIIDSAKEIQYLCPSASDVYVQVRLSTKE